MQTRIPGQGGLVFTPAAAREKLCVPVVLLIACLAASAPAFGQCDPPCDDGLFCTVDICLGGQCFNNTQSCQDGVFCNGVETCDDDRDLCAVACLDGGTCTGGVCVNGSNPGAACDPTITPINCPSGTFCSENLDACVECADDAGCTDPQLPFCEPASGTCVACYHDSQCSNGLFCDGTETCNLTTATCEAGTPVQCSLNPPTFCSELYAGACVECETAADCPGGTFCSPKACSAGACIDGAAPVCKTCVDAKNNQRGPCDADNDCDTGFTCTGAGTFCSDVVDRCVICLADSDCIDLNYCTRNECSKLDFSCQFPPDGSAICAERNGFSFCDGPELCVNEIGVCDLFTGANCCRPGTPPVVDDGILCTIDSCDEQNDVIVHVLDDSSCDDTLFCTGVEICDPDHPSADGDGCVAGVDIDCSQLDAECRVSRCDEVNETCVSDPDPSAEGTVCINETNCEDVDLCETGACVAFPPEPNDPYRCVFLELQAQGTGPFSVGDILSVDLIARTEGCVTSFPRCGPTEHPLSAITVILSWELDKLKLREAGPGNPNPLDPCDNFDPCFLCPQDEYNWSNSVFPFDCGTTGFNEPCVATGPANDGSAFYVALDQLSQATCSDGLPPAPACATEVGLHVTTFEFEILAGAQGTSTSVSFGDCAIEVPGAGSKAISKLPPPPPLTANVTRGLVDATVVVQECVDTIDCDDNDPCTIDNCDLGGICSNAPVCPPNADLCISTTCDPQTLACSDAPITCNDNDPCTSDNCFLGVCTNAPLCPTHPDPCIIATCDPAMQTCDNVPVPCGDGEVCFDGECFVGCSTVADCNDGFGCTVDSCEPLIRPGGGLEINACINAPDDALCDTGLFCEAMVCDQDLGCVFAHKCVSITGNPCPDQAACDDVADDCGGCLTPVVASLGPRYLSITPQDQGATPLALLMVGKCDDPNAVCISSFVQSTCVGGVNNEQVCQSDADCPKQCNLGANHTQPCTFNSECSEGGGTCVGSCSGFTIGSIPSFHSASFWGEIRVGGVEIHPGTEYDVHVVCDFTGGQATSAADSATTSRWGDVNQDGAVNVFDITGVVDQVKKLINAPVSFEGANVWPCAIDTRVNVTDITLIVDAVKGFKYPCASTCP